LRKNLIPGPSPFAAGLALRKILQEEKGEARREKGEGRRKNSVESSFKSLSVVRPANEQERDLG
jgi:hypothetical protein